MTPSPASTFRRFRPAMGLTLAAENRARENALAAIQRNRDELHAREGWYFDARYGWATEASMLGLKPGRGPGLRSLPGNACAEAHEWDAECMDGEGWKATVAGVTYTVWNT